MILNTFAARRGQEGFQIVAGAPCRWRTKMQLVALRVGKGMDDADGHIAIHEAAERGKSN
tara:strand:- start:448 stop:627 length:180 start_codon:yes stop_codon:yes gene_type:complete